MQIIRLHITPFLPISLLLGTWIDFRAPHAPFVPRFVPQISEMRGWIAEKRGSRLADEGRMEGRKEGMGWSVATRERNSNGFSPLICCSPVRVHYCANRRADCGKRLTMGGSWCKSASPTGWRATPSLACRINRKFQLSSLPYSLAGKKGQDNARAAGKGRRRRERN